MPRFYHCGCCEQYHSVSFDGDCRQDDARFNPEDLDEQFGVNGWTEVDQDELDDEGDMMSDAEADADVLRSAGMGTDEDYGYYGERDDY